MINILKVGNSVLIHQMFRYIISGGVAFIVDIFVLWFFTDSLDSIESKMSIAYFSLYFALKLVSEKYPKFMEYAAITIMLAGIYQSVLVLRQLYGFDYSNHSRFAVTGSFYNPGPCGIFLSAVLVLAVAMIRNCTNRRSVAYITAYTTIIVTLLAVFPTMSRAGWIGAGVGIALLYRKTIMVYFKSKLMVVVLVSVTLIVVAGVYVMKKDSADGRLFMWRNAIRAFVESPVTGVGIGNFAESYSQAQYQYFLNENVLTNYNKNIDVVEVPTSVFNEPISLALMLGVVGVLFAGFISYRKTNSKSPMFYVALSILVASLFSYSFYIPAIGIVFIFAIACIKEQQKFLISSYLFTPLLLLPLLNYGAFKEIETNREWKNLSMFYSMKSYDTVCEDYLELLPSFERNYKFMFEYGHSLNKMERYDESNDILLRGERYSTDPMFWTIIGNNYMSLGMYDRAEEAYLRAYYQCPNRLYPIYLLTKLFHTAQDQEKTRYYGTILLNKKPKINSSAVTEMKDEITKILNNL